MSFACLLFSTTELAQSNFGGMRWLRGPKILPRLVTGATAFTATVLRGSIPAAVLLFCLPTYFLMVKMSVIIMKMLGVAELTKYFLRLFTLFRI